MKNWQSIYLYVLGGITTLCFAALVFCLIFHLVPEGNNNLVYLVIGLFGGFTASVYGYFFGTSKGSSDKTDMLYKSLPYEHPATTPPDAAKP